jgi:hypothetical protein
MQTVACQVEYNLKQNQQPFEGVPRAPFTPRGYAVFHRPAEG